MTGIRFYVSVYFAAALLFSSRSHTGAPTSYFTLLHSPGATFLELWRKLRNSRVFLHPSMHVFKYTEENCALDDNFVRPVAKHFIIIDGMNRSFFCIFFPPIKHCLTSSSALIEKLTPTSSVIKERRRFIRRVSTLGKHFVEQSVSAARGIERSLFCAAGGNTESIL